MGMGSYSQSRQYHRGGYKLRRSAYLDRFTNSCLVHQIERYSAVSDAAGTLGTNRGSTWLQYGPDATTYQWDGDEGIALLQTHTQYPVHLFNLSGTGANSPVLGITDPWVGWKLAINNTVGSAYEGQMCWLPLLAWDKQTQVNPDSYPPGNLSGWELEDNEGTSDVQVGRRGMMEWTDIRMLFYGKKNRPTRITASFVRFEDESLAPEYPYYTDGYGVGSVRRMEYDAKEYWGAIVKPLVNNPCSFVKVVKGGPKVKVLRSYSVLIDPKETVDADTDPYQKFHKWFNRWNREYDYSFLSTQQQTNAVVQDPQQYPNVSTGSAVVGSSFFPQDLKGCVYLMLTSYQPDAQGDCTNAATASYDFNIRKSTGVMRGF